MLLKMKPNSLGLQQQTLLGADSNDSYGDDAENKGVCYLSQDREISAHEVRWAQLLDQVAVRGLCSLTLGLQSSL